MNTIRENAVFAMFCFMVFVYMEKMIPLTAAVLLLILWRVRTKDNSWILAAVILTGAYFFLHFPLQENPDHTARIIAVKERYAIARCGKEKYLVYSERALPFDAEIKLQGEGKEIVSAKGFFAFDFGRYMHFMRIDQSFDQDAYQVIRERHSVRHMMQKRISSLPDEKRKAVLAKVLLNIRTADTDNESIFYAHGFSLSGFLLFLNRLLKYFAKEKTRNKIISAMAAILCIIYRFPALLTLSFLMRVLSFTNLSKQEKTALSVSLVVLLHPETCMSFGFWISFYYRLSFLFPTERKYGGYIVSMHLQSLFFQCVKPLEILFFPFLRYLFGAAYCTCLLSLLFPCLHLDAWILYMDHLQRIFSFGTIHGSLFGAGLLFYAVIIILLCHFPKKEILIMTLFLIFLKTGFFHPFASFSVINVGQGDALLLRAPLNRENILIDTGRPSQREALETYLNALSVDHIHCLIITHADSDHSGNAEWVLTHKTCDIYETQHRIETRLTCFSLFDLNDIDDEDENRSSIVTYTEWNGLRLLSMADADQKTEKEIIRKYPLLQCDILKLSHHGSDTGSCSEFLDSVKPGLGLISSGSYSIYHHPSPHVIQRLLKRHIPFLDTKEEGDIMILSLGKWNILLTAAGRITLLKAPVTPAS